MKKSFIKILYRLFAFLSDCTNGYKLFVKYKLILGTLLIGLTTTSCGNSPFRQTSCYEPVAIDTIPATCYVMPATVDSTTITVPESADPTDNPDEYKSNNLLEAL